jgi:enoyl-[acyl-carrier protein] reductase II
MENRICSLFGIEYPIVQGGMIWVSGWRLASAVSNEGGLGLIGAGSMYPDVLREHIQKCKKATSQPFGVNVPLLYPDIDQIIEIIIEEGVKIVFTSAGNPAKYTAYLKEHGITVVHVVANEKFALKCQTVGVDAIVCEGFEAGGHNGREETTTMCLIPQLRQVVDIPLIAAGGIGSGQAIAAAMSLGADGVQIGTLFASSAESSAHELYKKTIVEAKDGSTELSLKELIPVRIYKNAFYDKVKSAELRCASKEELAEILGRGRAKKGIFQGDLEEGEIEFGQVSSSISEVKTVKEIMAQLKLDYSETVRSLKASL